MDTAQFPLDLEAEGGAVPLDSRFYVWRPSDDEFRGAVARGDGIVLVKGPRQVGKTSLLARGLQTARDGGAEVALLDFQTLSQADLESADAFCFALAGVLAEQFDLDDYPEDTWDTGRTGISNLTRYLSTVVFDAVPGPLVLGLDEVDRLFTTSHSDEVFAMFRGWHNRRALEPDAHWHRFTLAISFATEAHLFIKDLNQSPFNVGTRVTLRDFLPAEVGDLNVRYGEPLHSESEVARFCDCLGGHPFLTRKGLHDLTTGVLSLPLLEAAGEQGEGPFADHLRRMLILLARDPEMSGDLREFLHNGVQLPEDSFHRLRSAGVLSGASPRLATARCGLYRRFLLHSL